MTEGKNWREAKPKWVVDAAKAEMAEFTRRLALRWPEEARPSPVAFRWGEYDRLHGDVVPGVYFQPTYRGAVSDVEIQANKTGDKRKAWMFRTIHATGPSWHTNVVRGPLYLTRREAQIAALWRACETAAAELERLWAPILEGEKEPTHD